MHHKVELQGHVYFDRSTNSRTQEYLQHNYVSYGIFAIKKYRQT